ncbi:hypothetical protein LK09_08380 [Microbacterium mangrovi]|uniref:Uncharacterized protein n=1 Tax=Microbacterium mangrovi TaxID=1348253 RepID=A0A0B2AAT1_9MICO|nr:DUF6611 family protein [Microbacterium mangrovi]KHK98868.1 hypothetical protein LK09_08380 [Microbacterium mangrovi]
MTALRNHGIPLAPDPVAPARGRDVRLLGIHEWGEYTDAVARFGVERRDVVVFAPGVPLADRRWLRLWRTWPATGVLVGLAVTLAAATVMAPGGAIG